MRRRQARGEERGAKGRRNSERGGGVKSPELDLSKLRKDDVVILPAFGAPVDLMKKLKSKGVIIVDATCPWVGKVWKSVDWHRKKGGMTSIIFGKPEHSETRATASFAHK